MSIILITEHDESIYNVIEKEEPQKIKTPRYTSIHSKRVHCERLNVKQSHRTMGYAKYPLRPPNKFLKKHTGLDMKPKPNICCAGHEQKIEQKPKKPPVPSHIVSTKKSKPKDDNKPDTHKENEKSGKNFILRNIYSVIKAKPKEPVPRYVDTKNGTKHDLMQSGLEPHYILSKHFGKTPKYILRQTSERERREQAKQDDELHQDQPACRYITKEERDNLLAGLKDNWAELQKRYQGLPILTDSVPKILRKSQMQQELAQLEKDIVLIERHPYIYVYND